MLTLTVYELTACSRHTWALDSQIWCGGLSSFRIELSLRQGRQGYVAGGESARVCGCCCGGSLGSSGLQGQECLLNQENELRICHPEIGGVTQLLESFLANGVLSRLA